VIEDDDGQPGLRQRQSRHLRLARHRRRGSPSRARLVEMIDIAPDAIISVDDTQRIRLFNQGAEAVFGYRADDVLGRSLDMLLPVAIGEQHGHDVAVASEGLRRGKMGDQRHVFGRRKDGTMFPADASISKQRHGDAVTLTVILRDVSEHKRAEDAIRASEARLTAILETLPVGVLVTRQDDTIAYINGHAKRFVGGEYLRDPLEPTDSRPQALREGTDDRYPDAEMPTNRALRGEVGMLSDIEFEVGGERIPTRNSFAPIRDAAGNVEYGIVVFDDLLRERATALQLAHQADELARSNAELEQFAYIASHDLSEPLRTVAGFIQLLSQRYAGKLDDQADEFIGFVLDGVDRMQTMIKDLLTFSRVSRLDYNVEPVDTHELVTKLIQSLGLEESVTVSSPLPTVLGDRGQLERVFQNLMANGLKFASPLRPEHVDISAAVGPDRLCFTVRDNGIGISPDHRDAVQDVPATPQPRRVPGYRHWPVDLSAHRRAARRTHLGRRHRRRRQHVPLHDPHYKGAPVIDERIQILLVEDSAADVRLLREAMREARAPNDIQVATDGEQALLTMREGPDHASSNSRFDLVVLDLNLPRKGGLEVLAEIRRDPKLSLTPVIILTTSGAETDVRSALWSRCELLCRSRWTSAPSAR
jgi:PAS domain S-box-containing protein